MPLTFLLASKLSRDYPDFQFQESSEFRWSPTTKTIFYEASNDTASLLHELAHALLGHTSYTRDIELLEIERDAWHHTTNVLAPHYNTPIDENTPEDAMDTYRDWMHTRSICPNCKATGLQIRKSTYKCVACHAQWRVNDARICALRRYILNKKHTL
jgi:hypothetical protein